MTYPNTNSLSPLFLSQKTPCTDIGDGCHQQTPQSDASSLYL
ncbi:hypothetical protein HanIR_Chr05g0253831 [Helianthus annuus]|nr:hypothetical protein HanIR_Chr05g0253831 [Helianthus annuus]